MSDSPRVLLAMSGGVDSSVAALLLQEAGYEVVGAFLRNGVPEPPEPSCRPHQGCCSEADARDARTVAAALDIPFHVLDMEAEFHAIQHYFRLEYAEGRTPNPCVVCNRDIKFGALLPFADAMGCASIATGHYARLELQGGRPVLSRGSDAQKDQSYVLFPVGEAALSRTLLPLGGMEKGAVRARAQAAGLPVFAKPDSQEICFVPSGDYRDLLREEGGLGSPGRFLDAAGRVLGEHEGVRGFTRGQRRGLGIAAAHPLYVLDTDPVGGDVLVGPREELGSLRAELTGFEPLGIDARPGDRWDGLGVQVRSTPTVVPGTATLLDDGRVEVAFQEPADAVTPGQGMALYRGDRLLGGGWVERAPLAFRSS